MVAINSSSFDMILNIKCRLCYKYYIVFLMKKDYTAWVCGDGFIQDIMHYLSCGERELLISATCSDCFDKLFPSDLDNDV
jgi:hypothetical protein